MLLDKCLKKIASEEKQKPLIHWVKKAIDLGYLVSVVTRELCDSGILKKDQKQILWVFSRTIYPELNPDPEKQLKKRLRHLLLDEPIEEELTQASYERTVVIAILAEAAKLLGRQSRNAVSEAKPRKAGQTI